MQIQALLFFVLSATVMSRSVIPQPSLQSRGVGINSSPSRIASALDRRAFMMRRADASGSGIDGQLANPNPGNQQVQQKGGKDPQGDPKKPQNKSDPKPTDTVIPETIPGIKKKIEAETKKLDNSKKKVKAIEAKLSELKKQLKQLDPTAATPDLTKPGSTKPDSTKPGSTKPGSNKADIIKTDLTEPKTTTADPVKQEITNPDPTKANGPTGQKKDSKLVKGGNKTDVPLNTPVQ